MAHKQVKIDPLLHAKREVWLIKAANSMRNSWRDVGVEVPVDLKVTCGFPGGGSPRKRIGECWPRERSAAGVNEVFINPVLDSTAVVLDVLGHELLHAVDNCASGHGKAFSMASAKVGYSGGKTSKAIDPRALLLISIIAKQLGEYPHKALTLVKKQQKENTGLHKLECGCGNVAYMTAKKLDEHGFPTCGSCGEEMQPLQERQTKKVVTTI